MGATSSSDLVESGDDGFSDAMSEYRRTVANRGRINRILTKPPAFSAQFVDWSNPECQIGNLWLFWNLGYGNLLAEPWWIFAYKATGTQGNSWLNPLLYQAAGHDSFAGIKSELAVHEIRHPIKCLSMWYVTTLDGWKNDGGGRTYKGLLGSFIDQAGATSASALIVPGIAVRTDTSGLDLVGFSNWNVEADTIPQYRFAKYLPQMPTLLCKLAAQAMGFTYTRVFNLVDYMPFTHQILGAAIKWEVTVDGPVTLAELGWDGANGDDHMDTFAYKARWDIPIARLWKQHRLKAMAKILDQITEDRAEAEDGPDLLQFISQDPTLESEQWNLTTGFHMQYYGNAAFLIPDRFVIDVDMSNLVNRTQFGGELNVLVLRFVYSSGDKLGLALRLILDTVGVVGGMALAGSTLTVPGAPTGMPGIWGEPGVSPGTSLTMGKSLFHIGSQLQSILGQIDYTKHVTNLFVQSAASVIQFGTKIPYRRGKPTPWSPLRIQQSIRTMGRTEFSKQIPEQAQLQHKGTLSFKGLESSYEFKSSQGKSLLAEERSGIERIDDDDSGRFEDLWAGFKGALEW